MDTLPAHPELRSWPGHLAAEVARAPLGGGPPELHTLARAWATPVGWTWEIGQARGCVSRACDAYGVLARAAGALACDWCGGEIVWQQRPGQVGRWAHTAAPAEPHTAEAPASWAVAL